MKISIADPETLEIVREIVAAPTPAEFLHVMLVPLTQMLLAHMLVPSLAVGVLFCTAKLCPWIETIPEPAVSPFTASATEIVGES